MNAFAEDKKRCSIKVFLREPEARKMKEFSLNLTGLKRPNQGSISHFLRWAARKAMRDEFNYNMENIDPEIYCIPEVKE